jgi:hypothetical protein
MIMYKQYFDRDGSVANGIIRIADRAFIPFDPANTDYAEFKKAVMEGAELQDADGNVMLPEAAQAFVATLP